MSSPFVRKAMVPTLITLAVKPASFQLDPKSIPTSNRETSLAVSNLLVTENPNQPNKLLVLDFALTDDDFDLTTPSNSLLHPILPTQPVLLTSLPSEPVPLLPNSSSTSRLSTLLTSPSLMNLPPLVAVLYHQFPLLKLTSLPHSDSLEQLPPSPSTLPLQSAKTAPSTSSTNFISLIMTTVCSLITCSPPVVSKNKVGATTKTTQSKIKLISPQKHKVCIKVKNPCQRFLKRVKTNVISNSQTCEIRKIVQFIRENDYNVIINIVYL